MAKAKSGAPTRQPWIKWYARDWRADPPLRMCSYAARGLWADLLSLMAESRAFGFLMIEGVVPTSQQLAGLLGGSEREVIKLTKELGDANVYSLTGSSMPEDVEALIPEDMPAGVMLSRRMVRDKAKADKDRENGKGGGNPNLTPSDNHWVNPIPNPQSQKPELDYSEAKASGADAPDPVKLVFDAGVKILTATGLKEPQARSLIGKWRKDNGDEAVLAAIGSCQRSNVSEPVSWITATFKAEKVEDRYAARDREVAAAIERSKH